MGPEIAYRNGDLTRDVHEIKEDVHTLKQSITNLSKSIDGLSTKIAASSESMKDFLRLWSKAVPFKMVVMLFIIQAIGILGVEAGRALIKAFL